MIIVNRFLVYAFEINFVSIIVCDFMRFVALLFDHPLDLLISEKKLSTQYLLLYPFFNKKEKKS